MSHSVYPKRPSCAQSSPKYASLSIVALMSRAEVRCVRLVVAADVQLHCGPEYILQIETMMCDSLTLGAGMEPAWCGTHVSHADSPAAYAGLAGRGQQQQCNKAL